MTQPSTIVEKLVEVEVDEILFQVELSVPALVVFLRVGDKVAASAYLDAANVALSLVMAEATR